MAVAARRSMRAAVLETCAANPIGPGSGLWALGSEPIGFAGRITVRTGWPYG